MIPIQDKGEALRLLSDEELTDRVDAYMKGKRLHKSLMKIGFKKWAPHLQKELCDKTGIVKIDGYAEPIQSSLKEETVFFIEDARELFNLYANKQITIGKLTELLNEKCSGLSSLTPKSIRDSDGWISVEDRLPDYDEYVLWICENGNCYVEALDKDGNPWLLGGDEESDELFGENPKATHWQPLPAPPNEKSASLKPNKLTESDIETMAEEYETVIQDLIDAIPKQDNDHDWWPDELNKAVKEAEKYLINEQRNLL